MASISYKGRKRKTINYKEIEDKIDADYEDAGIPEIPIKKKQKSASDDDFDYEYEAPVTKRKQKCVDNPFMSFEEGEEQINGVSRGVSKSFPTANISKVCMQAVNLLLKNLPYLFEFTFLLL